MGAANKAVVYQLESRKRQPSPLFWQRIEQLARELALRSGDERQGFFKGGIALLALLSRRRP